MINFDEGEYLEVNNFRLDYGKNVKYHKRKSEKKYVVELVHLNRRILWKGHRKLHKIKGDVFEVHEWIVINKKTKEKGWSIFTIPVTNDYSDFNSILEEYADYSGSTLTDPYDYISCDPELQERSYNIKGYHISSKNIKSKSLIAFEKREKLKLNILENMLLNLNKHVNKDKYKILQDYLVLRINYLKQPNGKTLKLWSKFIRNSYHQVVIQNVKNYLSMRL